MKIVSFAKKAAKSKALRITLSVLGVSFVALATEILFTIGLFQVGVSGGEEIYVAILHLAAVLSVGLGLYRIVFRKKVNIVLRWIAAALTPAAVFLLAEFITHDPFRITPRIIFLNLLIIYLTSIFLSVLTRRTAVGNAVVTVLVITFGMISFYTKSFRGAPLFPWDIASAGTAAGVISHYPINFGMRVVCIIATSLLLVEIALCCNVKLNLGKWFIRLTATVLSLAAFSGSVLYLQTDRAIDTFNLYPYLFTPNVLYDRNGFVVSFLMNLRYITVEKPTGYSAKYVRTVTSGYESDKVPEDKTDLPNVIVVMNETLSDMTAVCDYETTEECFPFISSLKENTIKGDLHMSVVGGNTPNSEFEFLTGLSMAFLPQGSIPYQQFVKNVIPSLATQFDDLGYRTVAMHPYYKKGWKRSEVYPLLGFEDMYFIEDFKNPRLIRGYISDESVVDKIIDIYEKTDGPLFSFAVTMQNHGGYWDEFANFTPQVKVKGLEGNSVVSTYMSLMLESDKAFEKLIDYFSKVDEPTVVVMFGDHQPGDAVAEPLLDLAGVELASYSMKSTETRHITPYIIWTNYDTEFKNPGKMSANYLSAYVAEVAGLPRTAAQKYLLDLMKDFPTVNAKCFTEGESGKVYPVSDYQKFSELLDYSILQYSFLFDRKNCPYGFWTLDK